MIRFPQKCALILPLILTGACLMTLARPCPAAAPAEIDALFAREWQARMEAGLPAPGPGAPGFIGWSSRTTPPLPPRWPRQGKALVYYAYARGLSPELRDGEYAGPVWGMAEQAAGGAPPAFTLLAGKIARAGTQGVRPLTAEETELLQADPAALLDAAEAEAKGGAREKLRAYYCLEKELGNFPDPIPARHAAFFAWLGCP
jgi:hypothetical protein